MSPGRFLMLLLFFLLCVAGPPITLAVLHPRPLFFLPVPLGAMLLWLRFGPSPIPGLLQGLLGTAVLFMNVGLLLAALWRVAAP